MVLKSEELGRHDISGFFQEIIRIQNVYVPLSILQKVMLEYLNMTRDHMENGRLYDNEEMSADAGG